MDFDDLDDIPDLSLGGGYGVSEDTYGGFERLSTSRALNRDREDRQSVREMRTRQREREDRPDIFQSLRDDLNPLPNRRLGRGRDYDTWDLELVQGESFRPQREEGWPEGSYGVYDEARTGDRYRRRRRGEPRYEEYQNPEYMMSGALNADELDDLEMRLAPNYREGRSRSGRGHGRELNTRDLGVLPELDEGMAGEFESLQLSLPGGSRRGRDDHSSRGRGDELTLFGGRGRGRSRDRGCFDDGEDPLSRGCGDHGFRGRPRGGRYDPAW